MLKGVYQQITILMLDQSSTVVVIVEYLKVHLNCNPIVQLVVGEAKVICKFVPDHEKDEGYVPVKLHPEFIENPVASENGATVIVVDTPLF